MEIGTRDDERYEARSIGKFPVGSELFSTRRREKWCHASTERNVVCGSFSRELGTRRLLTLSTDPL